MYTLADSVPQSQLSRHAAERHAQLTAVSAQRAEQRANQGGRPVTRLSRLVRRVRAVLV